MVPIGGGDIQRDRLTAGFDCQLVAVIEQPLGSGRTAVVFGRIVAISFRCHRPALRSGQALCLSTLKLGKLLAHGPSQEAGIFQEAVADRLSASGATHGLGFLSIPTVYNRLPSNKSKCLVQVTISYIARHLNNHAAY